MFQSSANNLIPGDNDDSYDVFMRDLATHRTTRVSIGPDGKHFAFAYLGSISADGRYVGFDMAPSRGYWQGFVRDVQTGRTISLNGGLHGAKANGDVLVDGISADGRLVAFTSDASNLVAGDTNGEVDVFVRDLRTGATTRVSVPNKGQANGGSIRGRSRPMAAMSLSSPMPAILCRVAATAKPTCSSMIARHTRPYRSVSRVAACRATAVVRTQ